MKITEEKKVLRELQDINYNLLVIKIFIIIIAGTLVGGFL